MKTRLWFMALLALSAATLGACGGDDSDGEPEGGSGGSNDDGGAATSGGGGSGGTGGTGGSTGGTGGAAPMAMPITCGSMTCNPPENPLAAFAGLIPQGMALPVMAFACCLPDDECGYAMTENATGAACNVPAEEDPRCEDFMLGFGQGMGAPDAGTGLPPVMAGFGCCTDEGQCGIDGSLFGTGCNENSEARTMLQGIPLLGMFLVGGIPEAKACDAPLPDAGGDGDGDGDGDDAGQ